MEDQRRKLMWKCEDHMHISYRQKFLATGGEPLVASVGLTLSAVAVAAGVIRIRVV